MKYFASSSIARELFLNNNPSLDDAITKSLMNVLFSGLFETLKKSISKEEKSSHTEASLTIHIISQESRNEILSTLKSISHSYPELKDDLKKIIDIIDKEF